MKETSENPVSVEESVDPVKTQDECTNTKLETSEMRC